MKKIFLIYLVGLICIGCSQFQNENLHLRLIPALGDAPLSEQFNVRINGKQAAVEKIAKFDIPIHYTQIICDSTSSLHIEIEVEDSITEYKISPQRMNIRAKVDNNRLSFDIDSVAYLLVRINDMEDLYLLIDSINEYSELVKGKEFINILEFGVDTTGVKINTEKIQAAIDKAAQKHGVLYFPKGKYYTGELYMRSNMTVLLAEGALIMGSTDLADYQDKALIRMNNISNFHLLGYGVIDGAGWTGLRKNGAREFHLIYISECSDIFFDGVVLRDPTFWNTRVYRSKRVHFKNLKILNNRPLQNWTNTDGVDFDSSIDCSLVNAIIHAGDDNVVVKGLDSDRDFVTEKIVFDKVLTISNSAATKIGTETCVEYFRDIVFKNIDVVKCKRGLVINGFDSARIERVRFENIYIEEFEYTGNESPRLIDFEVTDKSWRECTGDCIVNGVEVININVLTSMEGVESQILGKDSVYGINNVLIKNCSILGEPASSLDDFHLSMNDFVRDIMFQ